MPMCVARQPAGLRVLAACLCAPVQGGAAYVPYRNSKLTRLLKDGLSGNSR